MQLAQMCCATQRSLSCPVIPSLPCCSLTGVTMAGTSRDRKRSPLIYYIPFPRDIRICRESNSFGFGPLHGCCAEVFVVKLLLSICFFKIATGGFSLEEFIIASICRYGDVADVVFPPCYSVDQCAVHIKYKAFLIGWRYF